MILGYHVTFGTYGFWLPNDPRGSGSTYVGSPNLYRFGRATKTQERRSLARRPHDGALRRAAKGALRRPAVQFTGIQARAVGQGFARCVARGGFTVWACAILPDHVHVVLARIAYPVERVVNLLKGNATRMLQAEGVHPFADQCTADGRVPGCSGRGLWKVYLNTPERIEGAIRYVEQNPLREGKPPQRWGFVTPYPG
jgi:REP element-mobilizing transposase RayT